MKNTKETLKFEDIRVNFDDFNENEEFREYIKEVKENFEDFEGYFEGIQENVLPGPLLIRKV